MGPLITLTKQVWRGTRNLPSYHRHLKNGPDVWLSQLRNRPLPPLRFRNGFTWYHGPRDEPILLFREIFIERFYEPILAPPGATVLDIGANIGAVSLFCAQARPDLRFHAYEPNPESYASLRKNIEANNLQSQVNTYPEAIGGARGSIELWTNVPTTLATAYGESPAKGATRK